MGSAPSVVRHRCAQEEFYPECLLGSLITRGEECTQRVRQPLAKTRPCESTRCDAASISKTASRHGSVRRGDFGEVTDTEDYEGNDLLVVDDPDNPVFDRVVAGRVEYGRRKVKLELLSMSDHRRRHADRNVDAAEDAVGSRTISWRRRPTATIGTT